MVPDIMIIGAIDGIVEIYNSTMTFFWRALLGITGNFGEVKTLGIYILEKSALDDSSA